MKNVKIVSMIQLKLAYWLCPVVAPSYGASLKDSERDRHCQAVDLRGAMRPRRYAAG